MRHQLQGRRGAFVFLQLRYRELLDINTQCNRLSSAILKAFVEPAPKPTVDDHMLGDVSDPPASTPRPVQHTRSVEGRREPSIERHVLREQTGIRRPVSQTPSSTSRARCSPPPWTWPPLIGSSGLAGFHAEPVAVTVAAAANVSVSSSSSQQDCWTRL